MTHIATVTNNYGVRQLVQEPTHILTINLVMESESIHLYIQLAIIRQSLQNLFCIHHLTKELFGFMKKKTLNLFEKLLMNLIV